MNKIMLIFYTLLFTKTMIGVLRRWNYMDWKKIGFGASLVSILASIGIYFAHDENLGIFVGLWASALLLLSDRLADMQAAE